MLSINAVVANWFGVKVKKESTARYPDAPPCPTEEYNAETIKSNIEINSIVVIEKSMIINQLLLFHLS